MIDIMMPYWGDPVLLRRAVESVRAQTSPHWRLTVVDDCYPVSAARYFQSLSDPRIRYLRNDHNTGIIKNFEKCRQLATEEFTVFMGCDDLLLPRYVEETLKIAQSHPLADVYQPGVEVIDEEGRVAHLLADRVKSMIRPKSSGPSILSGESLAASLFVGDWLYWPSLCFRTSTLKNYPFLEDYEIILDLGLILDMVVDGATLVAFDEVVFQYRRHAASLSSEALLEGPRFADERRFFEQQARRMDRLGWSRAAREARRHLTSRAYALSLVPAALKQEGKVAPLLTHAFGPVGRSSYRGRRVRQL